MVNQLSKWVKSSPLTEIRRNKFEFIFKPMVCLFLFFLMAGCGGGGGKSVDDANGSLEGSGNVVKVTVAHPNRLKSSKNIEDNISVSALTASIPMGGSQQFIATATYENGSSRDVTSSAVWASGTTSVSTIGGATGLAIGIATGTSSITATFGGKSGTTTLMVTSATLSSIAVTPLTAANSIGFKTNFMATGTFSDGSSVDISEIVTWSSSNTAIATIVSPGLATCVALGNTTIKATSGSKFGTAILTVQSSSLVSIAVTPPFFNTLPIGFNISLIAIGTFSDGTSSDISTTVVWSSNNILIAKVVSPGIVSSVGFGNAIISATYGSVSGVSNITVSPAQLNSISVSSVDVSSPNGFTHTINAIGGFTDGSSLDVSDSVKWTSSDTTIATVVAPGIVTNLSNGTVTITATYGSYTNSTTLIVTEATLRSISVTPITASIAIGGTQPFVATGSYSDGTSKVITNSVIWSSNNTTVSSIDSNGLATGKLAGSSTISASLNNKKGSATLTVTGATLNSISVTPISASVVSGMSQAFVATGTYSDGTSANISNLVTWTSGTIANVTISASGVATGISVGSSLITATSGTKSSTATLSVTASTLSSITVTPLTTSKPIGFSQAFKATGTFSDGSSLDITSSVTWSSSSNTIATVLSSGVATGVSAGVATITATSGSKTGSGTFTVTNVTLSSIAVTPLLPSISVSGTKAFLAMGTFSDASVVDITNSSTWTSSNLSVATVLPTGVATGLAIGVSTITATSGLITNSTVLTVTGATLVSIAVTPALPTIANGGSQTFVAMGTYSDASIVNITNTVAWTSSNLPVATILATGVASGASAGVSTITATLGLITNTATLTVSGALGPTKVDLGTAINFVILTKAGITNSVASTLAITGNIGSSPITGASMNTIPCAKVTGFVYEVDAGYTGGACGKSTAADKTTVDNAVLDMGIAFADAKGRTSPDSVNLGAGNISGMTLAPGLYKWGTSLLITNAGVTLSGGPNDVWIFQIGVDLIINNGAIITLTGGALAKNIFWQIDGQTTIGTTADVKGIFLSKTLISVDTTAVVNGRLFSQTAVTLQGNAVTQPAQ